MKRKMFFTCLCSLVMLSCSNDFVCEEKMDDLQETKNMHYDLSSEIPTACLNFDSMQEFNNVIDTLTKMTVFEAKDWIKANYGDFFSLYDLYDKALIEAGDMEESLEGINAFYEKYKDFLFFPKYKDDYGPYLPISNRYISMLTNAYGDVIISGKQINMKDISAYNQLQDIKEAIYDGTLPVTRAWQESPNHDTFGHEWASPWYQKDGRKIRLKCGRQSWAEDPVTLQFNARLHVEISFRKKVLFSWVNYSSRVAMTGTFSGTKPEIFTPNGCIQSGGSYTIYVDEYKEADSSHDYYYVLPFFVTLTAPHYPETYGDLTLDFRGMPDPIHLQFTINEYN